MQRDAKGRKHVVGYLSRRLGKGQLAYSAGKLELLALIVCLTYWRHYLLGCKDLTIETDHEPLLALQTTQNPSRMLLRWLHFIQQFTFTLKHRPGTRMKADLLSRPHRGSTDDSPPITITEDDDGDDAIPELRSYCQAVPVEREPICSQHAHAMYQLALFQLEPEVDFEDVSIWLRQIREQLVQDDLFKRVQADPDAYKHRFLIREGLLYRKTHPVMALYIPELPVLREALMHDAHYSPSAGHFGHRRSLAKLQRYYYWPSMTVHLKAYIRKCPVCLRCKRLNLGSPVVYPHSIPGRAWEVVCTDEVSGFPISGDYDAIWVFVCKLTKMCHFVPARKEGMTSEALADLFFDHVFRYHGLPTRIISDRDPRFDNAFWRRLHQRLGVSLNMSTPGHPQTDGQSEVTIRALCDMLQAFVNSNRDDWLQYLSILEFAYNDSVHTATGFTPFELNYGYHPRGVQHLLYESAASGNAEDSTRVRRLSRLIHWARISIKKAITKMVEVKTVRPRKRKEEFIPGDRVLLRRDRAGETFPQDKLSPLWVGPFTVIKRISRVSYVIAVPPRFQAGPEFHIDYLKRYPGYIDEPTPALPSGPTAPLPRLCPGDVEITSMEYIQDPIESIIDLYTTTAYGLQSAHKLIRRGHYKEVAQFIHDHHETLKFPFQTGKTIIKKFQSVSYRGILTAYDPFHTDTAYQVSFEDGDSEWFSADKISKSTLKRYPAP